MTNDDELERRLRDLPSPTQDAAQSSRAHRRARAAFVTRAGQRWPVLAGIAGVYGRAEPVLAASIVVVYLGWAVSTVASLWR